MGKEGKIRVVIANDRTLFREGLIALLRQQGDLEVVGEAANGREVLSAVEETHPDVLLLDLFIPEMGGSEVLPQIRERSSSTKVLILTNSFDQELIFRALEEGARGYLQRSVSSADLLKAIRVVHAGEAWIERSVMGQLLEELSRQDHRVKKRGKTVQLLSQRETDVASLVAAGLTNQEVANRLSISEKTVKSHLVSIFRKLQISHRLQLALYTLQRDHLLNHRSKDE